MKFIIQDYIKQLIEKDELDLLICDLLFAEGYTIDSIPRTGNRQFGVDIRAHNAKNIYMIVVKQGNINRALWNGDQNSVHQSIDEILDVHFRLLSSNDLQKKIHIVVATNGDLEESVRMDWDGFTANHTNYLGHNVDFDFWNTNELSIKIQKNLFNENLFPKEYKTDLRKALYFVEESDYTQKYYENLINHFIVRIQETIDELRGSSRYKRAINKQLSCFYLATQMIVQYSHAAQRNKIGVNIYEYLLIKLWKTMLDNNLFSNDNYIKSFFIKICKAYKRSNELYISSIYDFCIYKDPIPLYGDIVEQRLKLYEIIGQLSSYCFFQLYLNCVDANKTTNLIISLINNHPEFLYPPLDSNICQISLLFRLLGTLERKNEVQTIIENICDTLEHYYKWFHKYPASSDTYQEALDITNDNNTDNYEYNTSGFWGYMLLWIYLYDNKKQYESLYEFLSNDLKDVTKCVWFIHPSEENFTYSKYAMNSSGDGIALEIPKEYHLFREKISFIFDQYKNDVFSFEEYCFYPIELIASRYFNTVPRIKQDTWYKTS